MISILFAIIVESMFKQIPQIDITFGIGDIVGSIALIVSAFTFYISHSQASQSEQIRTSRDLWIGIKGRVNEMRVRYDNAHKKLDNLENANPDDVEDCISEIEYFAYLILKGEITDDKVLDYYKNKITSGIAITFAAYALYMAKKYDDEPIDPKHYQFQLFDTYPYIVQFIEKWSDQTWLIDRIKDWRKIPAIDRMMWRT
jgi:hypothetical protein